MRGRILILALLGGSATSATAGTLVVEANGSGDFATIQAAVDAAEDGDVIDLGSGTFAGDGNRDVFWTGKSLRVRSRDGIGASIVDCGGSAETPHRAFLIAGTGTSADLEGITIQNGFLTGTSDHGGAILVDGSGNSARITDCTFLSNEASGWGGAVTVTNRATATFAGCSFEGNEGQRGGALTVYNRATAMLVDSEFVANAAQRGGAVYGSATAEISFEGCLLDGNVALGTGAPDYNGGAIHASSATLRLDRCTLTDNRADGSNGGAIYAQLSTFDVIGCTLWGNGANAGAGFACALGGSGTVENTIIAGGTAGGAVDCGLVSVSVACTDIHDNAGGDWIGGIEGQAEFNGNFSADPIFCDAEGGDFTLDQGSPCAPFSEPNPDCDRIGVHEIRCGLQPVLDRSWGQVKAAYR